MPKFICQEHHENTSYSVADILNAFENGKLYYPTYYMLQGSGCNTLLTVRESSSVPDNITITLLYPGNGRKLSARVATQDLSVDDLLDKIGQFLRECGSSGRSD